MHNLDQAMTREQYMALTDAELRELNHAQYDTTADDSEAPDTGEAA